MGKGGYRARGVHTSVQLESEREVPLRGAPHGVAVENTHTAVKEQITLTFMIDLDDGLHL